MERSGKRRGRIAALAALLAGAGVPPGAWAEPECGPVPAVIDRVDRNPADPSRVYELANLCEGDHYFTDRNTPGSHILVNVPDPFRCAQWVKTPNDDKFETTDPLDPAGNGIGLVTLELVFDPPPSSVIYVGLDDRAVQGPDWLVNHRFADTGQSIYITETGSQTAFDVWAAGYLDGAFVELGGNLAPGANFSQGNSNYVVFAKPDTDLDLIPDDQDNCPVPVARPSTSLERNRKETSNTAQIDADGDGLGDVCDDDVDGDGILDPADNCPYEPNADQTPAAPGSSLGVACNIDASLGLDTGVLDITQRHHYAIDLDQLPRRGELRVDIVPHSMSKHVEVDVQCTGADFSDFCDADVPESTIVDRRDCARFARPVAFKVNDADDVVAPFAMAPFERYRAEPPVVGFRAVEGDWVVPFFVLFKPEVFDPAAGLDVTCHIELRRAPFSSSTDPYKAILRPRTKPARTNYGEQMQFNEDLSLGQVDDTLGEYGFFTPDGQNFSLLFAGDSALGQCEIMNDGGSYTAVPGTEGWNCCTFTYETAPISVHGEGVLSQLGHAAIWNGGFPEDPLPDLDGDTILDLCDNCLTTPNTVQENDDGDALGNRCDNCDLVDNPAQSDSDLDDVGDACDNCAQLGNLFQDDGDTLPAGDACQCSDVDASGGTDLADSVMARRFAAGAPNPASFSAARCVLDAGPTPCSDAGALALRDTLARATARVESCP